MEIYEFRQVTQASGETPNEFYRRLKEKASTCEFTNEEAEIRTQIIHKTCDSRLRQKALQEEMDLKTLLSYGLVLEKSDRHSKLLEDDRNGPRQANFRTREITRRTAKPTETQHLQNQQPNVEIAVVLTHILEEIRHAQPPRRNAFNAGKWDILPNIVYQRPDDKNQPPRRNEQWKPKYPQQNNQRKEVRGITKQQSENLSDTDEEFTYTIITSKKPPELTVKVADMPVRVIVDTGSSVNLLNQERFKKMQQKNPAIQLHPTKTKVFAYRAKEPLHLLGEFTAEIRSNSTTTMGVLLVT